MTSPLPRRVHPAGSRSAGGGSTPACPVCTTRFRPRPEEASVCPSCGVVLTGRAGHWTVDLDATRAAMIAAADACAGEWSLWAVTSGKPVARERLAAYRQLEIAETGLATLVRLSR
jgi:hypothetical protein